MEENGFKYRLRTGLIVACAVAELLQSCICNVRYFRLCQEYQEHLKVEAEFLEKVTPVLQEHF